MQTPAYGQPASWCALGHPIDACIAAPRSGHSTRGMSSIHLPVVSSRTGASPITVRRCEDRLLPLPYRGTGWPTMGRFVSMLKGHSRGRHSNYRTTVTLEGIIIVSRISRSEETRLPPSSPLWRDLTWLRNGHLVRNRLAVVRRDIYGCAGPSAKFRCATTATAGPSGISPRTSVWGLHVS